MEQLLKPIGRRNYFIGLLVISFTQFGLGMLLLGSTAGSSKKFFDASTPITQESVMYMIPIGLFFLMIKMGWDFKRLKDISGGNSMYYYLLLIPVVGKVFELMLVNSTKPDFIYSGGSLAPVVSMGVFGFVGFVYALFLIFKKGAHSTQLSSQATPVISNQ